MTSSATRPGNANLPSGASCIPPSPLLSSLLFLSFSSPIISIFLTLIFCHFFLRILLWFACLSFSFDLRCHIFFLVQIPFPALPSLFAFPFFSSLPLFPSPLLCHFSFLHLFLPLLLSDLDKNLFVKLLNRDSICICNLFCVLIRTFVARQLNLQCTTFCLFLSGRECVHTDTVVALVAPGSHRLRLLSSCCRLYHTATPISLFELPLSSNQPSKQIPTGGLPLLFARLKTAK